MTVTVLIIINKDEGHLGPSETFLHAHINGLPCNVITLIGNIGYRCLDHNSGQYLQSRSVIPLGLRWLARKSGFTDISTQDRRALGRYLRREKISAVLAEYGPSAVSVMEACNDANVPLISHFHGWDAYSYYLLNYHETEYKRLFQVSSAIIAVSQHMMDQLISLGANRDRTFHNACGAEIPDLLKAHPDIADCRFVMVGRLTEKKAPFISIIAFAEVVKKHSNAYFDVVGDGPLREACIQLCKGLGISSLVKFHGAKSHKETLEILSKGKCFVQHSVTALNGDREGTPVGVLEAMGLGLPVVTTRHGGIIDIVEDGVTGSLVDEYDADGMARAMINYATDSVLAKKVGDKARAVVLENWISDKSIARLWNIIEQTIKK